MEQRFLGSVDEHYLVPVGRVGRRSIGRREEVGLVSVDVAHDGDSVGAEVGFVVAYPSRRLSGGLGFEESGRRVVGSTFGRDAEDSLEHGNWWLILGYYGSVFVYSGDWFGDGMVEPAVRAYVGVRVVVEVESARTASVDYVARIASEHEAGVATLVDGASLVFNRVFEFVFV